ncbi:MAG: PHP domain-containing protein, partial [Pseudomonadota bacterium]
MSAEINFAEIVCATNFSFLRGASHPEELVVRAHKLGLSALAVADRNTLAGVVRAHAAAKEAGVRFLVGCRLVFEDGTPDIVVYPTDRPAYGRLTRLLTVGNLRGEKGAPRLFLEDLIAWREGLLMVVMPGEPDDPALVETLEALGRVNIWLGASMAYQGSDRKRLDDLARVANRFGVPLIATNDALYHDPRRRPLQDVLTCIREHVPLARAGKRLEANAERYLKPPEEMARLFRDHPQTLAETERLIDRVSFSLDELAYDYPDEPTGESATPQEELERLTWEGAANRYPDGIPKKVEATLRHELSLVKQLDYAPYFLTVYDI